jgi:hypothetical protein
MAHWMEEWAVLQREEIMMHVQHARGRLGTCIEVSVDRRMYEPGRIMDKGSEINDILETT